MRAKLLLAGISDPFSLPDMHALLDVTELIFTENMDDKARAKWNSSMYRPELPVRGTVAIPAGFTPDEELDSFTALEGFLSS